MRFLVLDHLYARFVADWYGAHPGLADQGPDEQRESVRSSLVGEIPFQAAALRSLGHEATDIAINVWPAQAAWLRAHGPGPLPARYRLGLRRRGVLVPWPTRYEDPRWMGEILLRQVEAVRPDVVHVSSMDLLPPAVVREIRARCRFVVGQIAARLEPGRELAGYDLVVSAVPSFVDAFRSRGVDAEWLPLAFEPAVAAAIGPRERTIAVSFAGSLFGVHHARLELLRTVAARVPVDVWTSGGELLADGVGRGRTGGIRLHPAAWGARMYGVLAGSRVTLNVHGQVDDGPPREAANLRLYEATGMGALLVTDRLAGLDALFDVGREVVAYADAREAAELAAWYVENPDEAAVIAEAGRRRTLREHTWADRMERLVEMIRRRI